MSAQRQSPGRLRNAAMGAALAALMGLLFAQPLANLSFDLLFRLRSDVPVQDVMIVAMDEGSTRKLGQPWDNGSWDRTNHARLLNRLKDCGAKAVVFDLFFDRTTVSDDLFIKTIEEARQNGTIVIVGGKAEISGSGQYQMTNEVPPFAALEKVAPWGLAELELGTRAHRRHFAGTDRTPSLALRTAELALKPPPQDLPAERWINFYGPPGFVRHCSYCDALDPKLTTPANFSNKVCFVGAWPSTPFPGGVRTDEWSTPFGKAPGVEITATVFLNLWRHDWLRRLSSLSESLIVVLAGIVFGFGLGLCRPVVATGAGILAALTVATAASSWMRQQQVWFSWLGVVGVQIPVAIGWSVLAYTKRLTREKALLEEKLVTATFVPPPAAREGSMAPPGFTSVTDAKTVVTPDITRAFQPGWMPAIPDHTMLRCVGKGAYGEVWLARNAIGTYHAVKIIRRADFEPAEPYEREFRGLQKFMPISHEHPGLVLILHVGRHEQDGFIYYIMEPADDEVTGARIDPNSYSPKNLAKEIRKRGHLPAAECLKLGTDLTGALEFLHQHHLIHRDIKPANIIYVKGVPKLADIGLVTDIATTGRDVTYLGTKGYIAPEGPGTPAADVYSLGKVLYEASTGLACEQFPEIPATLVQRPDHPELLQLNKVILRACRQDSVQRYQTAAEMRDDLLRLHTSKP